MGRYVSRVIREQRQDNSDRKKTNQKSGFSTVYNWALYSTSDIPHEASCFIMFLLGGDAVQGSIGASAYDIWSVILLDSPSDRK